jgi:hypothetical protein
MKKLILSAITSLYCFLILAQVPQGFSYQAIARDASGQSIINTPMPVRITIQSDSLGGTIFWQELYSSVTTNSYGLINLIIGKGSRIAGTATNFSTIDWSITPKFVKTEINYGGWKNMGSSRLWSVPYAMVAGDLDGPLKKLSVTGETGLLDEALFEVKNKDGQTIFAVYNEGVRVYVSDGSKGSKGGFAVGGFGTDKKSESTKYLMVSKDSVKIYLDNNPLTKKPKGGFAVGGFDLTKGIVQDYFNVTSDSVRIYIDNNPTIKKPKGGFAVGGYDLTKGLVQTYLDVSADSIRMYIDSNPTKKPKGGFAVGGFDLTKGANINYLNVNTDASGIINPSQNRILWYPNKNAFLTGKVLIEKPDSVGENSFSSGFESKALGGYSQALGFKAIARGDYSTAIGKNAIANKINSFAFGEGAFAGNDEGYAIGRGAVSTGYRSFAFGSASVDSAGIATDVTRATGDYSFAIGGGSQALDVGAFTFGIGNTALGPFSIAMGYKTTANQFFSTSIGNSTHSTGFNSTAMGYQTTASGKISTSMGRMTTASGDYSTAIGNMSQASGLMSTAIGAGTTASGDYSTAIGNGTQARLPSSTAMGYGTIADNFYATAMGNETTASGRISTAMGYLTTAPSAYETAIGIYNTDYIPNQTFTWDSTDRLFVIGNGWFEQSNAMTILKNGHLGLQSVTNPTYAFELPNNSDIGIGHARAYAWDTYSDDRIKSDKEILQYGLTEIMQLNPLTYSQHNSLKGNEGLKIENAENREIGLIAQEVFKIIPEVVSKPKDEQNDLWSMSYEKLVPVLIKGMQEQQSIINKQQKELDDLKSIVNSLINNQAIQSSE